MTAPTKYIRNARLVRLIDGDTIVLDGRFSMAGSEKTRKRVPN